MKFRIPIVNHSLKYNPAVDGLRGIAISLVFIFHLWPEYFSFGYVGVDIFFVLSGFLITKIIYTKLENKTFTIREFYRNRVRRIFPAMTIVLVSAFIVGYLFMFASELKSLGQHMKSSILFYQNFRLMGEVGYWDKAAELKPLLHFWSLSIEEQFYVFWPLLLIIIYKLRLNLLISLGFICVGFILSSQVLEINNFYHSLSRFWELSFGALVFAITTQFDLKEKLQKFKYIIFICFIASVGLAYANQEFNFPILFLVILSSGCLLLFAVDNPSNKILASSPLVFLGLISFPLYLWHYVIISFTYIFNIDVIFLSFYIIILSILLSYLTYRYVELYIRNNTGYKFAIGLFFISLILITALGQRSFLTGGFEKRSHLMNNKQLQQQFEENINHGQDGNLLFEKILGFKNKNRTTQLQASSNDLNKKYIVLMGDSHAYSAYDGFWQEFKQKGYETLLLGNPGCKGYPQGSKDYALIREDCKKGIDDTYKALNDFENIEKVIFIATIPRDNNSISYLFEYSSNKNYEFYFLVANPTLDFYPDSCATRPIINIAGNEECQMDYNDYKNNVSDYMKQIVKSKKEYKNINILDANNLYCDNEYCTPIKDGNVLFKDHHHLSVTGSKAQAKFLIDDIFGSNK